MISRLHIFLLITLMIPFTSMAQYSFTIPTGGNSWVTANEKTGREKVTSQGWRNWQRSDAVWNTYVKVSGTGLLSLAGLIAVPQGASELSFSIEGVEKKIMAAGAVEKEYYIGDWRINEPGYVKIETKGISKTGQEFAQLSSFRVSGSAVDSNTYFVKNNEGNYFYWGRRGPSVHINYDIAGIENIEWFYNEITVPDKNDVIGSYFMANGFAEGYFGMQVNSATERRIIFSVWSPFKTDNPKEVPEDQKIILVKKGEGVVANEFGNEGSGGHSHMVYDWKSGKTYRFLLHGEPQDNNRTKYSAFFYDPEKRKWLLIASFIRPATTARLKRLHSFLENFIPETGNITRMAYYHNQWVKPVEKNWQPLNTMFLSADATARIKYRMDYGGGIQNGKFYMKNGGFFNESAELRKPFTVSLPKQKPDIDLVSILKLTN